MWVGPRTGTGQQAEASAIGVSRSAWRAARPQAPVLGGAERGENSAPSSRRSCESKIASLED